MATNKQVNTESLGNSQPQTVYNVADLCAKFDQKSNGSAVRTNCFSTALTHQIYGHLPAPTSRVEVRRLKREIRAVKRSFCGKEYSEDKYGYAQLGGEYVSQQYREMEKSPEEESPVRCAKCDHRPCVCMIKRVGIATATMSFISAVIRLATAIYQHNCAAQIGFNPFSRANNMCDSVESLASKIEERIDQIPSAADIVTGIKSSVEDMLNSTVFASLDIKVKDVLKACGIVVAVWVLVKVARLSTEFVDIFTSVLFSVMNISNSLLSVFKQWMQVPLDEPVAQMGDSPDAIYTYLPKILAMFASIFVAYGVHNIPGKDNTPAAWLNKIGNFPRAMKSMAEIYDYMVKVFKTIYTEMSVHIFGHDRELYQQGVPEIVQWQAEVELYSDINRTKEACKTRDGYLHITLLYSRGHALLQKYSSALDAAMKSAVQRDLVRCTQIKKTVESMFGIPDGVRPVPLPVWLVGESQIGKTTMQYIIAADLCAQLGIYNVEEQIFCRCVENEYWEGYNGQTVVVFDDFGQMRDTTGSPNLEFFEIIRSVGSFPYPLHMADISLKSNSFFTSPIILCSTNAAHMAVESLTYEDAIWNRLTHSWRVTIKPEYAINEVDPATGAVRVRLNVPKAKEDAPIMFGTTEKAAINMNVYNFERFRAIDRARPQYEAPIEYEAFIKIHCEELMARQQQGVNMNANIRAYSAALKAKKEAQEQEMRNVAQVGERSTAQSDITTIAAVCKAQPTFHDMQEWYLETNTRSVYAGPMTKLSPTNISQHLELERSHMCRLGFNPQTALLIEYNNYIDKSLMLHLTRHFLLHYYSAWHHAESTNKTLWDKLKFHYRQRPVYYDAAMEFIYNQIQKFCNDSTYRFWVLFATSAFVQYAIHLIRKWWNGPTESMEEVESDTRNLQPKARRHLNVRSNARLARTSAESDTRNLQPKARKHLNVRSNATLSKVNTAECEMGLDSNMMSVLEAVRQQQWFAMLRYANGDSHKLGTITNVTGTIYMMPDHFVRFVTLASQREELDRIVLVNVANPLCDKHILVEDFIHDVRTYNIQNPQEEDAPRDLCFIDAGRTMPRGKNIIKHFMSNDQLFKLANCEFNGVLSGLDFNSKGQPELVRNHGQCQTHQKCTYYLNACGEREKYVAYDIISYSMPTKAGDCGQLLHCNSSTVRGGRIVGMHISTNGVNTNYSQVVTMEDIERAVQDFPGSAQCEGVLAHLNASDATQMQSGFMNVGTITPLPQASKSCISKSTLHGLIAEPTCKPAHLKPFTNKDGELVDPLAKGVNKAGVTCGIIDKPTLKIATTDVKLRIAENHVAEPPAIRVLTYEEAVKGIEGNDLFQPINRSTSPGYPWCLERNGAPGKTKWIGNGEYDFTSPDALKLREAVDDLIEACRTDQTRDIVWIDTLKDERRPIEKVDEGKTRVFSNGPMHYNIAFRKYFMGALAHIRHNRIYNGIGVGLNVWSNEWNFLAEYLTANSQTMIDGDFSNYDGTLSDQIMWEAFEVLHSLYDDGPENYTIRKNLWYYACFATRICRDKVYQCTHSLPSGFPATAEVNSIYQLIAFRCIYLKLARIHNPSVANMACFNKFVRLIIYGDDNIVSISEEIIAWFNMETIKDAFKKYLNMTYTNPQKTDEIVISKTLKDVSFLKRSFRRPTVNGYTYPMYVCPADLESRLEMLNWTRTGNIVNPKDIESDIVCEVFKELAMHGSKIYDQYVPMISKLAMQHGLKNIYDLGCETYIDSVVKNIPLKMHPNDFF